MQFRTGGANLLIPGVEVRQGGGGDLIFLLRDDFTTPAAAPLTSPRTCEPGPGTLTITDTNNKLSVASGKLSFATGGVSAGDPGAWGAQLARVVGRAVVAKLLASTSTLEVGWDNGVVTTILDCIRANSTAGVRADGVLLSGGETLAASTEYQAAIIQRTLGNFFLVKGGAFTNWTLIWAGVASSGASYPALSAVTSTTVGTADNFRVLDLPAPFNDSYGLVTQRLAGARSAGDTFVHEANCVLEYVVTTLGTGSNVVQFREQDATNFWKITIDSAGTISLGEVVAGSSTTRGSAGTVVASGHRVVVVCNGTTIRVYSNNVLRFTYSSASNFATAVAGRLNTAGSGGVISDIISWPRTLSGAAAAALDLAVA